MLALRVTRSYQRLKPFFEKLSEKCDKLVAYQHDESSRVHVHALVVNCKPSTDTLKNWIREVVGKVDRSDWSFITQWEGQPVNENFIIYMSKGVLAPNCCYGFTDDQIEVYRNAWVTRPKKIRQSRLTFVVKETTEQRKMRQEDMVKEIVKRYEEFTPERKHDSKELIALIYQVVAVENKNVIGRYKVRDYYDTIMAKVHKEPWLSAMTRLCIKEFL